MLFTEITDLKYINKEKTKIDLIATNEELGAVPMTLNLVEKENLHTFKDADKEVLLEDYCLSLDIADYTIDLAALKQEMLDKVNKDCKEEIIKGFKSNALGEEHFYYSTLEEQSTLNSLINLGADSPFKAQKITIVEEKEVLETRKQYMHTIVQLRQVLQAGAKHIGDCISKKDNLEEQINNAATIEEIEQI